MASAPKQLGIFLYNIRGKWERKKTRIMSWEVEREAAVLM
jgi:hypothetical protein